MSNLNISKNKIIVSTFFILFVQLALSDYPKSKINNLIVNNPGQQVPELSPEVFAPNIISTKYAEFGIAISPDLSEIYFTRRGESPNPKIGKIMFTKELNGVWTKPEVVSFSGVYNDMEPLITPNGKRLIFGSNRPQEKDGIPGMFLQWYVEKTDDGWSESKVLGPPFSNRFVMYPTSAENDNMYFTGEDGIYKSVFLNNYYQEPIKLGNEINSLKRAAHPYIAPDETYMIFDAQPRGDLKSDLFISYQKKDGSWTIAESLGKDINTSESQAIAMMSPDGKLLFFVRNGEIYWVKTDSISKLNQDYINAKQK